MDTDLTNTSRYELTDREQKILFSPVRLGVVLLIGVFFIELIIMLLLEYVSKIPPTFEFFLDSSLLSLTLTPLVILYLLRPLKKLVERYKLHTNLLDNQNKNLEKEVLERTSELTKVVKQLRDEIAARDQAEKELQQSLEIESIGQLAGGVAHDFNNMLGVILGRYEMALRKINRGQPVEADIQEIRKAADHSADLTRQLLTFARKQPIAPRITDLNESIAGMLKMLQRLIGENIQLPWTKKFSSQKGLP